jgi:Flp pilus assembly protein TadG
VLARLRGAEGANAVEFAIVLPILIVLIFGILYGGIAYNRQLAMTQSAREGARFAATLPLPTGTSAPDGAWFAAVIERIEDSSTGELTAASPGRYVCIRFVDDAGVAYTEEFGSGNCTVDSSNVDDRARVEVVVSRPATLDFIFYEFPVTLRGASIARFEGRIGT